MVSRMLGVSYASRGWYFPDVLRTRQGELAYLEDMYCRRIDSQDWNASCISEYIILY